MKHQGRFTEDEIGRMLWESRWKPKGRRLDVLFEEKDRQEQRLAAQHYKTSVSGILQRAVRLALPALRQQTASRRNRAHEVRQQLARAQKHLAELRHMVALQKHRVRRLARRVAALLVLLAFAAPAAVSSGHHRSAVKWFHMRRAR